MSEKIGVVKQFNLKIKEYETEFRQDKKGGCKRLINEIVKCAEMYIYFERVKKGFFISPEEKKIKAMEVSEYIMKQYLTRPNFKLKMPNVYIKLRVYSVLYPYRKKIDRITTYTDKDL